MKFFIYSACCTVDLVDHFGGRVVDLELFRGLRDVETVVVDQVDQEASALSRDRFIYFWHRCSV